MSSVLPALIDIFAQRIVKTFTLQGNESSEQNQNVRRIEKASLLSFELLRNKRKRQEIGVHELMARPE